jgi:aspartate aminotransferase
VLLSEGAWYLLVRSPLADDGAFAEMLAAEDVFVLPGRICELPGYFRISLTANDEMVERSLNGFAHAMELASTSKGLSPKFQRGAFAAADAASA